MAAFLHRLVDAAAMWTEDRHARAPVAFRATDGAPLACFGPLPPLPSAPPRSGVWHAPSPRPSADDGVMEVLARPAAGAPRGIAVLVPPWKVPGHYAIAGYARLLAHTGWDVWTLVPPRHLSRSGRGVRSGEEFVTPDLPALRAAIEQLVLEIRVLASLAAARGGETALVGLSLGALAAGLAATGSERVDRVALLAPPADLAAVLGDTAIGRRYRRLAARAGTPIPGDAALEAMLAPFRPDLRRPPPGELLLAVGTEDRIALSAGAVALARAWGVAPRLYRRGHLTLLFACRALRRDLARFLAAPRSGAGARAG